MPEGPELRLMADFLNQYKNSKCHGTEKSEVTKINASIESLKNKESFDTNFLKTTYYNSFDSQV